MLSLDPNFHSVGVGGNLLLDQIYDTWIIPTGILRLAAQLIKSSGTQRQLRHGMGSIYGEGSSLV